MCSCPILAFFGHFRFCRFICFLCYKYCYDYRYKLVVNIATNITTNITTKNHHKLDKSLIEIHHKFTTSPPQVHHIFLSFSPHLGPPQLVVLFVVFYPVVKFTTYVLLSDMGKINLFAEASYQKVKKKDTN